MKYIHFILMICLCSLASAEVRSVWVLPWDITSPALIDEVIATALDNHQTELLVEVRYRSDALFDTSRGASQYANPEPRSHVLNNASFDPLAYVLDKGHAAGLQIHAWVIVFNATPLDAKLLQRNYIYTNHRDWLTVTANGSYLNGDNQFGYFVDPGVPEVQDYLLNVLCNLVVGYPGLDGLHLDYIRYPDKRLGYHPVSVTRYNEYVANGNEITFNEWRIMQVTSFVHRLRGMLKELDNDLLLSAAVFADIADANVAYAQDWVSWLQLGLVDRVYPMAYNTDFEVYKRQLQQMKLIGKDDAIIPGLRAWDTNGKSLAVNGKNGYNVTDIARRIDYTRQHGFGGNALFSYPGLKVGDAWDQLKRLAYPELMASYSINDPDVKQEFGSGFKINASTGEYIISIKVPEEGRWKWEIASDKVVYSRYRYYMQGQNWDFWNGKLDASPANSYDGQKSYISPGEYRINMQRDGTDETYSFTVQIDELELP